MNYGRRSWKANQFGLRKPFGCGSLKDEFALSDDKIILEAEWRMQKTAFICGITK